MEGSEEFCSAVWMTLLTLAAVGVVWGSWGFNRGIKTIRERLALIDYIFRQPNWQDLNNRFEEVQHTDHAKANRWLRDPKLLYHPSLHPAFDQVKA